MAWHTAGQAGPGVDLVQLGDHGFERQGHVGPGVAVGHGIDIQAVDVGLVQSQAVTKSPHHRAQFFCAHYRQGGHGWGC